MRIVSAQLRHFRCFASVDLDFESPVVLIHGPNGSGKTSVLEALHYACYLRSFKTHLPREIVQTKAEGFAVGLGIVSESFDTLSVQFNRNKKAVKLNEQSIGSYKELYNAYRVITVCEDDLLMIQGAPALRRSFMDHMVLLMHPEYITLGKKYRSFVDNRNALLHSHRPDAESYVLWTDKLLETSLAIQKARKEMLHLIEEQAQLLFKQLFSADEQIALTYDYARPYTDIVTINSTEELLTRYPSLQSHETAQKRSLFGAHLDDFSVSFQGKTARTYASRGQQKLIVFLLKLAQLKVMQAHGASGTILLVDDFMTDFDMQKAEALLPLITSLPSQVIITSPVAGLLQEQLTPYAAHSINLEQL